MYVPRPRGMDAGIYTTRRERLCHLGGVMDVDFMSVGNVVRGRLRCAHVWKMRTLSA